MGVLVTLGGVEYGWLHAEAIIENKTSMDATIAPRFILAICISSFSSKSFDDSSTSHLARQAMEWEIRGIAPLIPTLRPRRDLRHKINFFFDHFAGDSY